MMDKDALQKRCERERRARQEAEALLEEKSLELYRANQALKDLNIHLEQRVQNRTEELAKINIDLQQEITERQAVEQRLLVTQFSVDRASEPVYWLDQQGRIVYANQAASVALGYTRDELQNKYVFGIDQIIDEKSWPEHWEELRRRGSFSLESTHRTKQGKLFPVEVLVNHIETGGVEYNCAYVRNISERRERLQASERFTALQNIVQEITQRFLEEHDMSRSISSSLSDLGQHLGADRAYLIRLRDHEQMAFGTHEWLRPGAKPHAAQIQNIPLSEFGWWVERLAVGQAILADHIEQPQVPERFGRSLRAVDTRFLFFLPVFVDTKLTGIIGIESTKELLGIDEQSLPLLHSVAEVLGRSIERRIAERERDQHRRELATALKSATLANQAKTIFLANMSHEIRTPLTAISGYSQMLQESQGLDTEQTGWVQQIQSSVSHLSVLINDVLDLSKIEGGELPISMQTADLKSLVKNAVDLVAPLASSKDVSLDLEFAPGTPEHVETDCTRLKQITINLIQNAVKFTDRGGVKVIVRPIELDLADQAGYEIEVADTGIGMSRERLEQVFRPLNASYYSIAGERGGAGLGLTLSRHLANLMHGDIRGRSKPNYGSVMSLRLPVGSPSADQTVAQTDDPQSQAFSLAGVRCLAIDDNPDNQRIIQYLLNNEGAQVTVASSGREGLELATSAATGHTFDVVLLDIQMPVMDGYTVARAMRREGIGLPIIALTAQAMADDRQKCLQAGFDDYVTKPINLDLLTASIRRVILMGRQNEDRQPAQPVPQAIRSTKADDERFQSLLNTYIQSLSDTHKKISLALDTEDWKQIGLTAHKLRGTGANYGFERLSEAAKDCESLILEGADLERKTTATKTLLALIAQVEGISII